MELDRERQSANQASSTSLVLGSWHEPASNAGGKTAEARAQRSTQHAGNDWRWPMPNSRLIKKGRKLGNYLYTKAASSAKGEKKIGGKLNIDYFS